jgi:hypothetical protein
MPSAIQPPPSGTPLWTGGQVAAFSWYRYWESLYQALRTAGIAVSGILGLSSGGTGSDLSGTGGPHQVLRQNAHGAAVTVGQLSVADISGLGSPITNSLAADVLLTDTNKFFDGPSIAQGTSGTWWVSGKVTLFSTSVDAYNVKLWDGTTVIDSAQVNCAVNRACVVPLSGFIANPAGNLRISAGDWLSTNGKILANGSGAGKDSTISAFRIA